MQRLGLAVTAAIRRPHRGQLRSLLVAITAVALLVRVLLVLGTGDYRPNTDAADYDRMAVSLAMTDHFPSSFLSVRPRPTAFRPPAFPIFLAGVYKLVGTASGSARWEAGRLAEAALGSVTVLLAALIALELFGPAVAIVTGVLAAVYPPLLLVGSSLLSESLFIPLVLGATLAALHARRRSRAPGALLACGGLIALAGLTRSVGLVIALPLGLMLVHSPWLSRTNVRRIAAVALAAVVTLTPWTLRNLSALHAFVPVSSEGGLALAGTYEAAAARRVDFPALWRLPTEELSAIEAHHPNDDEVQISGRLSAGARHYVEAHPAYVLKVFALSLARMLGLPGPALSRMEAGYMAYDERLAVLSVYAFWIVGVLALAGLRSRAWRRAPRAVWWVPLCIVLLSCFYQGSQRYRAPADPFILMLAAIALTGWIVPRCSPERRTAGLARGRAAG